MSSKKPTTPETPSPSLPVIMYRPEDAGTEVQSSRGNLVKIRKYHMTPEEMILQQQRWMKDIKAVPPAIRKLAHPTFFNPYRKGIYYAQLQALYLMGANRWHQLSDLLPRVQEIMESIQVSKKDGNRYIKTSAWNAFKLKSPQSDDAHSKDIIGRIQENFIFFQRLTRLHPSGYKLRQVAAALDMKRTSRTGFPSGIWSYRLHTYDDAEQAYPLRDFTDYDIEKKESRFVTHRFIGKIILRDRVIAHGVEEPIAT